MSTIPKLSIRKKNQSPLKFVVIFYSDELKYRKAKDQKLYTITKKEGENSNLKQSLVLTIQNDRGLY
jgi:hypothetical protein